MKKQKPENRVITESSKKLNSAYGELDNFVIELCKKYTLNYYELFGFLEFLKINHNDELNRQIEEEN